MNKYEEWLSPNSLILPAVKHELIFLCALQIAINQNTTMV